MHLSNIISQQSIDLDTRDIPKSEVYIHFFYKESQYAIEISQVCEVVEAKNITPYPQKRNGHIGVISLRGQIIPIMDFLEPSKRPINAISKDHRILIIEVDQGFMFGLVIKKAKRVEINSCDINDAILNIGGHPVQLLTGDEFDNLRASAV